MDGINHSSRNRGLMVPGLIRKRFHGVPHYLVEAKEEPGNYNVVQIVRPYKRLIVI